ncbi:MarR family winged helix-turn-helix transcriptional regulator [Methylovirgula sp. 4M-Z18]|uniref:MarR family winged helix-turn-helix transcriptional regulator n=1 Tax=Methylovirgula sp. 4M-Z18 TaxID=2293567 RepID=UPI000E2FB3B0|nr:MarR family transcriptional regulator [Methylovirgula sp. 4M-Z18]RFB81428.1 MarR family transcriptional regulator [Methylovirgula sp. 4M-Z18]
MSMPEALSKCLVLNTVAAARTLLRQGDARFKPFGATVQQFSLLAAIRFHPGQPVMSLAQRVLLDRTSLTRNLDLLEQKGLVRRASETVGNVRVCELTKSGNRLLDQLLVAWQQAQTDFSQDLSQEEAETYLRIAKHFANG